MREPEGAVRAGGAPQGAWEAFDARLRELALPEPAPGLRERCLPGALPRRLVLVVDDEPAIRRLVEVHLTAAGYEVETAVDGEEALRRVWIRRPDLIVLDVLMPGPDGFQVLAVLKSDPATAEIPVLMLTARGGDDPVRRGWQNGVDFYMTKPFQPEDLRAVVDRIAAVLGTPENPPPLRRWAK